MANKREFSSGDAMVAAFGKEVSFKKISYSTKLEATKNYTGNNKATSHSFGKSEDECKLEVFMSQVREWEVLRKAETGKADLTGMKVDLAVTYINELSDEVTDKVSVILLNQGREIAGGADGLSFEFETLCLSIEFNA